MNGFSEAISNGRTGLVLGNSVFLPFHLELLSIWIGKDMSLLASPEFIVDLCEGSADVSLREGASYTNIVFRRYHDLVHEFGSGKGHVVLHATEKGADVFIPQNRHYIRIGFVKHHKEITFEHFKDPFEL
jgi:hypothetical protein